MGVIVVRFTTKTSSASLNDAIKIAEKCEHYTEGIFYFVHFDEPDVNLQKLLELVKSWKTTKICLDDQEVDVKSLYGTFYCQDKLLCDGICTHPRIGWLKLNEFIKEIRTDKNVGFVHASFIKPLTPFLEKTGDEEFKLNKEQILDWIKNEWFFELEHCPIINTQKIFDLVEKIPDKIKVRNIFDFSDDDSDINMDETDESEETEEIEDNTEFYEEIAEIFADAFENRLRKVFKEFHKAEK